MLQTRSSFVRCFVIGLAVMFGSSVAMAAAAEQSEQSKKPYQAPNDSWITLDGTVTAVRPDQFTLDYGKGVITVEMDDGDRDADAYKLIPGDRVEVTGRVDDDLFETRTIEAGSVYVPKLGTTFYSSALDEEDHDWTAVITVVSTPYRATLRGRVSGVDKVKDVFTIGTGARKITVDISGMPYNPLDMQGYRRIEKGDLVTVSGWFASDFSEGRTLDADHVIILST